MAMFGHRSPIPPDAALLARVSDDAEVDLGTYPEAVLAVVGVNPMHGSPHKRHSDDGSPFGRLDDSARDMAMQAALDQLIAEGAVQLTADVSLKQAVEDGLHGRLGLSEPLATLHELAYWCHRRRLRFMMGITIGVTEFVDGEPGEVRVLAEETCFGLPEHMDHVLVERADNQADTRTYTLRTVRREFIRLETLLFSDFSDATTPGEVLGAKVQLLFMIKSPLAIGATGALTEQFVIMRNHGEDTALASFEARAVGVGRSRPVKPRLIPYARGSLANSMSKQFAAVAARVR